MQDAKNKLGLWSIIFLGINGIIGSGVFLLPNKAMDLFGPWSLVVLIFDMVLALCIALCFAEASSLFKDTGGPYIFAKEAFGDFVGYEVGFITWATRIIAFATMSVGFATALLGIFPEWNTVFMKNVISIGLIALLSILNLCGVQSFKIIQNAITIGKVIPLVLFIAVGIFFIDVDKFVTPATTTYTMETFGSTAILLFYAFTGFEGICVVAGDMKDPKKDLPGASIITLFFCSVVYFLLLAICIGVMGPALAESTVPVQDAFAQICGPVGGAVIAAGTLISIGGICIASSFITPRSGLALAEKHMLPAFMTRQNRFGAPYWCIIFSAIIAMAINMTGTFTTLAAISVVARFAQYIPTCLAVIVFRKTMKDAPRSFKLPFGNTIPILAVLISIVFCTQVTLQQIAIGLGALVIAVPFYFIFYKPHAKKTQSS